jgi:hypothetical protein
VVVELLADPTRAAAELLRGEPGIVSVQLFGERLHATLDQTHAADPPAAATGLRRRLEQAGISVQTAHPITPSLEDVFISRIREVDAVVESSASRPAL